MIFTSFVFNYPNIAIRIFMLQNSFEINSFSKHKKIHPLFIKEDG